METFDELCAVCSKVDFFSLFTGPRYFAGDGYNHKVSISLGTLAEINNNTNCPCCRLLHHNLYETSHGDYWLEEGNYVDPSKIQVYVHPLRIDYREEMRYTNGDTRDLLATILEVRLGPLGGLSNREENVVRHHHGGYGIQLLSPDSVDPARPLLNGYQVTNTSKNLELIQKWMKSCTEIHTRKSKAGGQCTPYFHDDGSDFAIQVIDVEQRTIVERRPESTDYAALSYVWEKHHIQEFKLQGQHEVKSDLIEGSSSTLPPNIPKVVEDAILVCKKLSISFLWVDRYCIDQADQIKQGLEIERMGYRYLHAKITLVAGMEPEAGLLPASGSADMDRLQKIELIQGRKYITALPSIRHQLQTSQWIQRAWTMQEGQFANRCAFFGKYDISFLCSSGHWRESLHSGPYAHEATMADIETECEGYYLLSWRSWLKEKPWNFGEYSSLLRSYTPRQLSFEFDKLNAVTGCLNFIAENKGVSFICGLPATDFHYALLWTGEYDRTRQGFPSWSWAGWHCLQQSHQIYPLESGTCSLEDDGHGILQTKGPICRDIELDGLYIQLTERPHRANKCSQRFADIALTLHKTNPVLTINSEMAHFSLEILPCPPKPREKLQRSRRLDVPHDFDSTITPTTDTLWESTSEYPTPFDRLRLRDDYGNIHTHHYPYWYDHWPPFKLNLPSSLRGKTLAWILKEGIELVMILEVKLLEGHESLEPFHLVLCLGIDRSEDIAKRCGMFCLPKEIWDKACPKMGTVTIG